jgi:hypothetical protein
MTSKLNETQDINEEERNLKDDDVDSVFTQLQQEIIQKRIHQKNNPDSEMKPPYYCKICGLKKETYGKIKKCKHCNLSLCKSCSSNGFCINCWINMKNDARKTIKLFKLLSIASPFLLILLLYQAILEIIYQGIFNKLVQFLIGEIFLAGLMISLYFLSKNYINKYGSRYFESTWEKEIMTGYYRNLINPFKPQRYILKEMQQDFQRKRNHSVEKLKSWIDPEFSYDDVPIPAHILENKEEPNPEKLEDKEIPSPSIKYHLIGKECPELNCHEIIKFADFCPECNVKYCPECNKPNNPYNRLCLCGFVFPSLKEEYFRFIGHRDIEFQKKNKLEKEK